ncbi:unnamed protein product [Paramecium pentaurelia]|uniref:Uncharacterized protein n=1 Tax=Paramecium pentaurelia TaxID=43138 RepID=A0A8S1VQU2_9CILI|nr:unnamed protein product [Paramecium pentaurelia]
MERQLIQTSGQLLLVNFLSSHPNANLTTILDFIVQDGFNEQNNKLFIEYVIQSYQTFWEMLLIINFDETSQNSNYPFIVTEMVKNKPEQIFDFLFQFNQIELDDSMTFLFQTIDRDCLDETIAGYFSTFICSLIKIRGSDLWSYLQINGKYIYEDLIKNIHINHIADIIYNLIALINNKGNLASNYNQDRICLLNRTIDILLNKYYDSQIVENVCNILIDLLKNVTEQDLKQLILEKICIPNSYFDLILQTKSSLLADLLIQLLYEIQQFTIITLQIQPDFEFNYQQFQYIGQRFGSALTMEININNFISTYGVSQEILGYTKLKLIEFYYRILQNNNLTLINYFNHQEIFQILIDFIQRFEFNNQLQNYFMEIILFIFCNQNLGYIQQIIIDSNFLGFLYFLNKEYLKQVGSIRKPITKGYQGIVNKLSYFFREVNYNDEWNQYIENHQKIFNIENNYLYGIPPGYEQENQQENIMKPQQEEKQEESPEIEMETNLPIQLNKDQVKQAVVFAENNFQDQSNFGEVLGEQILHQITKKQKIQISKSGSFDINTKFDFSTRFFRRSSFQKEKYHMKRRSLSQEKVKQVEQVEEIKFTQSVIFQRQDETDITQNIDN